MIGVVVFSGSESLRGADASSIVVSLYSASSADGPEVLISDVARVETRDLILKRQIEQLDLADTPAPGHSKVLTARLIEFRLRLAGINREFIVVRGSQSSVSGRFQGRARQSVPGIDQVGMSDALVHQPGEVVLAKTPVTLKEALVSRPTATLESDSDGWEGAILAAARTAILAQLPWSADTVSVRLALPLTRELALVQSRFPSRGDVQQQGWLTCSFQAQVKGAGPPIGRVLLDVTIASPEGTSIEIPVALDIRHLEYVVTTVRPVARGKTLVSDDLCLSRRDVTGSGGYCTRIDQVAGRVANHPLAELHVIKDDDCDDVGSIRPVLKSGGFVVKPQDRLKLVAREAGYEFSLSVEAMQNGRIGDAIQLKNIQSGLPVTGRILSATEAELVR